MNADGPVARLGRIVGGVVRQALSDADVTGVRLLDADTPEGALAGAWLREALGDGRVFTGAVEARVLRAHPASKTVLLLGEHPDAELLPLGDVWASEVAALAGDWSAPDAVRALADAAGDVAVLDRALRRWTEEREPLERALAELEPALADRVAQALERQRWRRWRPGLVPKLTARTLGIDLWD